MIFHYWIQILHHPFQRSTCNLQQIVTRCFLITISLKKKNEIDFIEIHPVLRNNLSFSDAFEKFLLLSFDMIGTNPKRIIGKVEEDSHQILDKGSKARFLNRRTFAISGK